MSNRKMNSTKKVSLDRSLAKKAKLSSSSLLDKPGRIKEPRKKNSNSTSTSTESLHKCLSTMRNISCQRITEMESDLEDSPQKLLPKVPNNEKSHHKKRKVKRKNRYVTKMDCFIENLLTPIGRKSLTTHSTPKHRQAKRNNNI